MTLAARPRPLTAGRAARKMDSRRWRTQRSCGVGRAAAMLTREEVREQALAAKDRLGLTWPRLGEALGRSPVYAAMLAYGYGQATAEEADALARALGLPAEAK